LLLLSRGLWCRGGMCQASALPVPVRRSGERPQGSWLRRGCAPLALIMVHCPIRLAPTVQVAPRPDVRDEVVNLAVSRAPRLQPRNVVDKRRVAGKLMAPVTERTLSELDLCPPPNADREDALWEHVGTQVEPRILKVLPPRAQR
jgi:hypothetical protein